MRIELNYFTHLANVLTIEIWHTFILMNSTTNKHLLNFVYFSGSVTRCVNSLQLFQIQCISSRGHG